ncbi:hypothetical protein VTN77DRAFT_7958 [Rasamsonia byssochlamydoides]|uniref:uncharacterized protein n=1 Tax=Rasamsonia byssochlamydoides TaxID=89139 RepID=UPI0037427FEE
MDCLDTKLATSLINPIGNKYWCLQNAIMRDQHGETFLLFDLPVAVKVFSSLSSAVVSKGYMVDGSNVRWICLLSTTTDSTVIVMKGSYGRDKASG